MRRMLQASTGDGGNSSGSSGMGLDIVDFVSLVRSNVDDLPEGRLLFFTTNHVDEMPIELVELVDKQGMRVSFPNATDVSTPHRFSSHRADLFLCRYRSCLHYATVSLVSLCVRCDRCSSNLLST
jgi:hypothetical protein